MAATATLIKTFVEGDRKIAIVDVTGDASYPTGGYPLTAAQLGEDLEITNVTVSVAKNAAGTAAWVVNWDAVNLKLQFYTASGTPAAGTALVEAANTTNLSTFTARLRVAGKGYGNA